jgi:hypothetical protein
VPSFGFEEIFLKKTVDFSGFQLWRVPVASLNPLFFGVVPPVKPNDNDNKGLILHQQRN